jgi:hypothetical protein
MQPRQQRTVAAPGAGQALTGAPILVAGQK